MENKEKFIDKLGVILMLYSRECVEITYTNGYKKYVDITGDSCIAIMSDVYKAMR